VALRDLLLATLLVLTNTEARPSAPSPGAAASPKLIEIAGYRFDPLSDRPPVPASLRGAPASDSGWWLVQLHRSPTRAERTELQHRFGLELVRHVPTDTYLEKLDVACVGKLRHESLVRAVVEFEPAFKISPALQALAGKRVIVTLFDPADSDRVVAKLRALGVTGIESRGGRIRGDLVSGAQIAEIARIDAVRWIEAQPSRDEDRPGSSF
jgi:hypothetical protein